MQDDSPAATAVCVIPLRPVPRVAPVHDATGAFAETGARRKRPGGRAAKMALAAKPRFNKVAVTTVTGQ